MFWKWIKDIAFFIATWFIAGEILFISLPYTSRILPLSIAVAVAFNYLWHKLGKKFNF